MEKNARAILELAAKTGVCRTGRRYLATTKKDIHTLVKVWKNWPEYFYEHSGTALEVVRANIDPEIQSHLKTNNIFVDYTGDAKIDTSDVAVYVMGDSETKITTTDYVVLKIYLFNRATVELRPAKNAIIEVEAWDNTKVIVHPEEEAKVNVYLYGDAQGTGSATFVKKEYERNTVFNGREPTKQTAGRTLRTIT